MTLNLQIYDFFSWNRKFNEFPQFNSINKASLRLRSSESFTQTAFLLCAFNERESENSQLLWKKKSKSFQQSFQSKSFVLSHSCGIFSFFITVAGLTDTCQLKYLNFNGNTLFCFHDTAQLVTCFLVNLIGQIRDE